jgi:hypothetical protein
MTILSDARGLVFETHRAAYALGSGSDRVLLHRYWDPRLPARDNYHPSPSAVHWSAFEGPLHMAPTEHLGQAEIGFGELVLVVRFTDGMRGADLRLIDAEVTDSATQERSLRRDSPALESPDCDRRA